MITISFDEAGKSYEEKNHNDKLFIGGFLYDDYGDTSDTKNEKNRIVEFFKRSCAEAGTNYPKDLHGKGPIIWKSKEIYIKALSEFFLKGTFLGKQLIEPERNGKYRVFINIYGKNGKTRYTDINADDLTSDERGAILYQHMVEDAVSLVVFNNPYIRVNNLYVDFPSRMTCLETSEFKRLGLGKINNSSFNQNGYRVADLSAYRTFFRNEAKNHSNQNITIDNFEVRSISSAYNTAAEDTVPFAFLLLADALCSFLQYQYENSYEKMNNMVKTKLSEESIVLIYSDEDEMLRKSLKYAEEKDIGKAIVSYSSLIKSNNATGKLYKQQWCEYVEKTLINNLDESNLANAVQFLKNHQNNKDAVEILMRVAEAKGFDHINCPVCFMNLWDIKMSEEYGEQFNSFSKVYTYINDRNIYLALENMFSIEKISEGRFLNIQTIKEDCYKKINELFVGRDFDDAVMHLDKNTRENHIDKSVYFVFKKMDEIASMVDNDDDRFKKSLAILYDNGIALCNHLGFARKAREYGNKFEALIGYLDWELVLERRNRIIVNYIDSFEYNQALLMAKATCDNCEKEWKKKKNALGKINIKSKSQAKAYSQFAQVCSFINENNCTLIEEKILSRDTFYFYKNIAGWMFCNAMSYFEKDKANYKITLNYYLHYLINMKNEALSISDKLKNAEETVAYDYDEYLTNEKYRKNIADYFDGRNDLNDQFRMIMEQNQKERDWDINFEYSLFLWCKGIATFYNKEEILSARESLVAIKEMKKNGHPWELIYLYSILALNKIQDESINEFWELLYSQEQNESELIKCITINSEIKYYKAISDGIKEKEAKEKLKDALTDYTNGRLPKENMEVEQVLNYTYC